MLKISTIYKIFFTLGLMLIMPQTPNAAVIKPLSNALETTGLYIEGLSVYAEELGSYTDRINQAKNGIMGPIQSGRAYLETAMEYQQKITDTIADVQQGIADAQAYVQDKIEQAQELADKVQDGIDTVKSYKEQAEDLVDTAKAKVEETKDKVNSIKDSVDAAKDGIKDKIDDVKEKVEETKDKVAEKIGSNKGTKENEPANTTKPEIAQTKMPEVVEKVANNISLSNQENIVNNVKLASPTREAFEVSPTRNVVSQTRNAISQANSPIAASNVKSSMPIAKRAQSASLAGSSLNTAPTPTLGGTASGNLTTPAPEVTEPQTGEGEEDAPIDEETSEEETPTPPEEMDDKLDIPELKKIANDTLQIQADIAKFCLADAKSEECIQAKEKLKESLKEKQAKGIEIKGILDKEDLHREDSIKEPKAKLGDDALATPKLEPLNIPEKTNTSKEEFSDSAATEAMNKYLQAKEEIFADKKTIKNNKRRTSFSRPRVITKEANNE